GRQVLRELRDLPVVLDEAGAVLAVALGEDALEALRRVVGTAGNPEALDGLERARDRVARELVVGFLLQAAFRLREDLRRRLHGQVFGQAARSECGSRDNE